MTLFLCFFLCDWSQVSKYLHNTHAKTHSNYTVDIVQIFRASREGEAERYRKVRLGWSIDSGLENLATIKNFPIDLEYPKILALKQSNYIFTPMSSFLVWKIECFYGMVLVSQIGLAFYLKVILFYLFISIYLIFCVCFCGHMLWIIHR